MGADVVEKDVVVRMQAYLKARTSMSMEDGGQMTLLPTSLVREVIGHIKACRAKKKEGE